MRVSGLLHLLPHDLLEGRHDAGRLLGVRAAAHAEVGSYARGDWGAGSDLDIVVLVTQSDVPFVQRALAFEVHTLPVPADVVVYTQDEWDREEERHPFIHHLQREAKWVLAS